MPSTHSYLQYLFLGLVRCPSEHAASGASRDPGNHAALSHELRKLEYVQVGPTLIFTSNTIVQKGDSFYQKEER